MTEEGGSSSNILLDAKVKYVPPENCSEMIPEYYVPEDSMLCAIGKGTDA
jgi:hypothetical protein